MNPRRAATLRGFACEYPMDAFILSLAKPIIAQSVQNTQEVRRVFLIQFFFRLQGFGSSVRPSR